MYSLKMLALSANDDKTMQSIALIETIINTEY